MGKRLLIQWDGKTLHDGEVDEIVWSDSDSGVSVQGKVRRVAGAKRTPGGGGILEALASARKQQTAKEIEERRAAAQAEVETDLPPEVREASV